MTLDAPGYGELNKRAPILGMWDDHDFGTNDAGSELVNKHRNRELFLDFLGESSASDRRMQKGTPIHQDYFVTKKTSSG